MPERRSTARPDSPDRRGFPRPPLWLTLGLLIVSVAALLLARAHRISIDHRLAASLEAQPALSVEMQKVRSQIADMNLTEEALKQEAAARLKLAESLSSNNFYIAIDTQKKQFRFHYGNEIIREAPVEIGAPITIQTPGGGPKWTFAPLKGAFEAVGKDSDYTYDAPAWVFLMSGQTPPSPRPAVANLFGRYVIALPNGYIIHSPPPPESPLKGAKPGSFMVPEEDLRAIWPRIDKGTKVFVF